MNFIDANGDPVNFPAQGPVPLLIIAVGVIGVGLLGFCIYDFIRGFFYSWHFVISGSGISLVFGAMLLNEYRRNLPEAIQLRIDDGYAEVIDRKKGVAMIPFSDFRGFGIRHERKRRYVAYFNRSDGGSIDLMVSGKLSFIQEIVNRLKERLGEKTTANEKKEKISSLPQTVLESRYNNEYRVWQWRDFETPVLMLLVVLFFLGVSLILIGAFREGGIGIAGDIIIFSIYGAYFIYSIFHTFQSVFTVPFIAIGKEGIYSGRTKLSSLELEKKKPLMNRKECEGFEFSLDQGSGYLKFRLLSIGDVDLLLRWKGGKSAEGFRPKKFLDSMRKIPVAGLSPSEAIRLQRRLNGYLK